MTNVSTKTVHTRPPKNKLPMKRLLSTFALTGAAILSGCCYLSPSNECPVYKNANGTVQRLAISPFGEFDTKTIPHAFFPASFGATASQYRWVHVQAITKVDRHTILETIARVPDQIPQLYQGDIVDVLFLTVSDSNFDDFKSAVVLRVVCKNEEIFSACRRQLYHDAGSRYFMGPTGEPAPDMSTYTFSKFYDANGKILPGARLPQGGSPSVANSLLMNLLGPLLH